MVVLVGAISGSRRRGGGGPADPVVRNQATFGAVGAHTAGSITAAYPSGITSGQLLELVIAANGGDATTTYTATGYTEIGRVVYDSGGNKFCLIVLRKVADGTESGSVTPTLASGTAPTRAGAVIERYTNVDTGGTISEGLQTMSITANLGAGGTFNAPQTTTTGDTGRLIINRFINQLGQTISPEAGWTEAYEFSRVGVGPDYLFALHYKNAGTAGAQDAETVTSDAGGQYIGLCYAIIGSPV